MKSLLKLSGIIVIAVVIGFTMTALSLTGCDNGVGGGGGGRITPPGGSQTAANSSAYSWSDSINNYALTITDSGPRAAVTAGDYTLVIVNISTMVSSTSSGTATSGSGGQITLSNSGSQITITINSAGTSVTVPAGAVVILTGGGTITMEQGPKPLTVTDGGSVSVSNEQVYLWNYVTETANQAFTGSGKVYANYYGSNGEYSRVEIGAMTNAA